MDNKSLSYTRWKGQYHIVFIISHGLWENDDDKTRPISHLLCGNLLHVAVKR